MGLLVGWVLWLLCRSISRFLGWFWLLGVRLGAVGELRFAGFCWLCLIAGGGYWWVLCGFPARLRALRGGII